MKFNRTTKSALFTSVVSLFLCFAMLLGTTFAWFTDSATSAGNVIKAGTLDVSLEYKTPTDTAWKDASKGAIFDYDKWEPGYTELRYVKIANEGSLDLKFVLTIVPNVEANDGETNLAEVIDVYMFNGEAALDRDAIAAATPVGTIADLMGDNDGAAHGVLYADAAKGNVSEIYTIVLKMRESAGNEYQGLSVGEGFSVNLLATQLASEADSFNNQYDKDATLPVVGTGSANVDDVDPLTGKLTIKITNSDTTASGDNVVYYGTLVVDAASLAPGADKVEATIEKKADPYAGNFTIKDDEKVVTYEIKVTGLKEGNTEPVDAQFYVGEGLNIVGFYHYDTEITDFVYNDGTNGNIKFSTATFSPFSIVVSDKAAPEASDKDVPKANVTLIENPENIQYDWLAPGQVVSGLHMVGENQKLDAAYTFAAPHTAESVKDSKYAGWYCDYFVSVDTAVEEGGIILGGQYTQWSDGWVGFYSPAAVDANYAVPLLSLVGNPWTYEDIVRDVATFNCGVADVDGKLAAAGAKFTVQLRLVNPEMVNINNDGTNGSGIWWESMTEGVHYIVVNTVVYDFANGTSVIDGTTVATTAEGLQEALNNGDGTIVLGNDIDLSQGLVIPGN